jgi:superfamily II DNA or RNA helicase
VISLRFYQSIDIAAIRSAFGAGHRAVLYVAPTGSGKTVLFTYIASEMARRGKRAWILVHRQELLSQSSGSLTAFDIGHGLISPQYAADPSALLQVASVQTLTRRIGSMAPPDLIIVDEAHHSVSESYSRIIQRWPQVKVLGVSATPERLDGKGLGQIFNHMVIGPTVANLTRDGYLAPATVYAPPQLLDMSGVAKRGGDFAKDETAKRVDQPTITGDAVSHYQRICPGVPAIAFCASVLHAEHVAAQFAAAGFRAASVDGSMDDRQRKGMIEGLGNGRVQVLTSCDLISEGLDIPSVTAAILLRPTQSLGLARQQIGRVLRPSPGKGRAIILDHVGNIVRHGLPTEEIAWTLEGGAAKRRSANESAKPVAQCERCYACFPPAPACPECGYVREIKARAPLKQVDGELVEVSAIEADLRRAAKKKELQACRTLSDYEAFARKYGYKQGFAYHRWQAAKSLRERYARRA